MKVDKHTVRYDVDKSLQLKEDVNPSQLTQKDLPWKHKRINDNDVDNDMISSLSWAYRNIIHEIVDFELPELTDFELKKFVTRGDDDSICNSACPDITMVEKENLLGYLGFLRLKDIKHKSLIGANKVKTKANYEKYVKYLKYTLKKFKESQYKYGGYSIVSYDNHCWEANLPLPEGQEKRNNLAMYVGSNEHLCEGIANHIGSRGLEGEFTITPWMEDYIKKAIDEGFVGWDGIVPMTKDMLEKGKKRAQFVWDAQIKGGTKLKSSQALYGVVGAMYAEDNWLEGTPKLYNSSEAAGRSTNLATAGLANCGEGWFQATGYATKAQCAQIAGISIPPIAAYTINNHDVLIYKSDADWGKLTLAYIYMQGEDVRKLMFDTEPKTNDELDDIACLSFLFKAGMQWDKKRHAHTDLPTYKRKFACADDVYCDFNGNGKTGAMAFLTSYIIGRYCGKDNKTPEEIKKELNTRFNIPAKIAKRWLSKSAAR